MNNRKVFPPLLHHKGHLEVVERDGSFAVMLMIDGWYADRDEADDAMRGHWVHALKEARRD